MVSRHHALPDCPEQINYGSVAELYAAFASLFLVEDACIQSKCGHKNTGLRSPLFHLASIETREGGRLFMAHEKEVICSTVEGTGKYTIAHSVARAKALPSARITMEDPDEVWEDNPKASTAKRVYVKEFNSAPYPFTVAFLGIRAENNNIVPISSFPCRRNDSKKWRRGKLVYQKHEQPSEDGRCGYAAGIPPTSFCMYTVR